MNRWHTISALIGLAALSARARGADATTFEKDVRPLVKTYCVECHNANKKKGDLDLAQFDTSDKALKEEVVWEGIAEKLRAHEMPPKRSTKKPDDPQRQVILDWVAAHITSGERDCGKIATDKNTRYYRGYVMSRRLTRAEYANTIRDLLGVEAHVEQLLPADGGGGEGFDTDGDALFTSAISIEKYLQAADMALNAALIDDSSLARLRLPTPTAATPNDITARKCIALFAARAYRRPIADAEVDKLVSLYEKANARGDSFSASLKLAFKAVLISPNFLFLAEPIPTTDGVYALDDYPLASRLSYFLWSSMPDEELFTLARHGKLQDEQVLRQQVQRMLLDPKSKSLAQNFSIQWLGVGSLGGGIRPDPHRFPQFDDDLAAAERDELVCFVDSIIREDRSLLDLIDANYTFVNEPLAKLYGIPNVSGDAMRRVSVSAERGGVMSMAAVLTTTSYPLRTSPVLRGKWVMESILGERVPPPPPSVPSLPQDDRQPDGLSFRARLEEHRKNPECAGCHSRMDPLGFGLENFDAIGRWRTRDGSNPIDSSGVLPSGEKFNGPSQLKALLLARRDAFLHHLGRKMLGYALGRELNRFDQCVLTDMNDALKGSDDRPQAMIETIVLSKPFRYRYSTR